MARPSDWSVLGYGSDPTPGDPAAVRLGGQHYQGVADSLSRAATILRGLDGGSSSGSQSVTALLDDCGKVLDDVTKAEGRYRAAGDALVSYSYALDQVQSSTAQALSTAQGAAGDAAENRRLASMYLNLANNARKLQENEDLIRYNRLSSSYKSEAAADDAQVAAQKQVVAQAVSDRDTAAERAISQIEAATSADGLRDTWWDNWGAWVVGLIATAMEWVATVAGVLALLLAWCPLLSGALLVISAIAGVVAALANIVLAATGEESWWLALLSIGFAVLGCIGLRGLADGIFGTLRAGGKELAGMGARGLAAGTGKFLAGGVAKALDALKGLLTAFRNLTQRAASSGINWAKLSGMWRDALRGKGNFGIGSGTRAEDMLLGRAWTGPGARLSTNGKGWISADGLRLWRPAAYKPRLGKWQSNFQMRWKPSGEWQTNGHLDIIP